MSVLNDIFGSLVITPEQRLRLRSHEANFRTAVREQAADETRKADQEAKLEADLVRVQLDQGNRNHAVAFSAGMGAMRRFDEGEDGV